MVDQPIMDLRKVIFQFSVAIRHGIRETDSFSLVFFSELVFEGQLAKVPVRDHLFSVRVPHVRPHNSFDFVSFEFHVRAGVVSPSTFFTSVDSFGSGEDVHASVVKFAYVSAKV